MSSKGTLNTGAAGRSPPEHLRATRSQASKITAKQASTTPQAATLEKKIAKARDLEIEARELLVGEACLDDETNITHHTILSTLTSIIQKYSTNTPPNLAKALAALVVILKKTNNNASSPAAQLKPAVDAITQKLEEKIEKTMQEEVAKMSSLIKNSMAKQRKALSPPGDLADTVTTLKQVASDMSKSINEATTATSHINDMALNYKQALLRTAAQAVPPMQARVNTKEYALEAGQLDSPYDAGGSVQTDPRIIRDLDRKSRQILIDTLDPDITGASQADIKEKVTAAIKKITDPTPPEDTTVLEVIKLRKGGFTILFKDKEIVSWLQDPRAEFELMSGISRDATIVQRSYSLLIPHIPLSFDLSNKAHLREIEECNNITAGTIRKARWIKPVNRRVPGQRAAHAIFTFGDITIANECIRDSLKVCRLHI